MSNDNTPKVKKSAVLKVAVATVGYALGKVAFKIAASIAFAAIATVTGFVLAGAAAWLVPAALPLAPLAVAKIGALVGLLVRVVKEAA